MYVATALNRFSTIYIRDDYIASKKGVTVDLLYSPYINNS